MEKTGRSQWPEATNKNIVYTALYFAMAVWLTAYFIAGKFWLYNSTGDMVLYACIAGAKWLIQVIVAFIFLRTERWLFLKRIAFVCCIGSVMLYLYYFFPFLSLPISGFTEFAISIISSVVVMVAMYYQAVRKTNLSPGWFWSWMVCLTIAVMFQFVFVFKR